MPVKDPNSPMLAVGVIDRPLGLGHAEGVSSDDAALVDAIHRSAPGSREALYHRYKRRVFALAVRIVGAMDAEEVSQEAFIRIFRGLPKFRGDSALGTWIYRLSVNAALSHRSRRGPIMGLGGAVSREMPLESSAREAPPTGDAVLRARLERGAVAAGRLSHRHRAARHRGPRARGGGADPGCHVGTSKSQLHKARGKLRENPVPGGHHRRRAGGALVAVGEGARGAHVVDQLSAYLEGDLGARATESVRAHLAGCAACERAALEMRAIVVSARGLERPKPPPTLWPAIEGALARGAGGADDAGLLARGDGPILPFWRSFWRSFWRPVFLRGLAVGGLAGATLVLVIGAAIGLLGRGGWSSSHGGGSLASDGPAAARPVVAVDPLLEEAEVELQNAADAYERSIDKLRTLLAREEPRWNAEARAHCAERLARLDEAITRSRDAARRTPGDSAGSEILFAAYRNKIDFLAAVVQRGGPAKTGEGTP